MHAAVGREGSVVFKWVVTGTEHSLYPPLPHPNPTRLHHTLYLELGAGLTGLVSLGGFIML